MQSGATATCTQSGGNLVANSVEITADPTTGRKCEAGKYYIAKTSSAAASCGSCTSNCHTCTGTAASACTHANAGYFRASSDGALTACAPTGSLAITSGASQTCSAGAIAVASGVITAANGTSANSAGSGAALSLTCNSTNNAITAVTVTSPGSGWKVGNILTVPDSVAGVGTALEMTLTAAHIDSNGGLASWAVTCTNAANKDDTPTNANGACPVGNTHTANPSSADDVCTACAANSVNSTGNSKDCVSCGTIGNAASGATYTCAAADGSVTSGSVTLVADSVSGLKCADGYFFTEKSGSTNASCTQCVADCAKCTAAGVAGCTHVAVGHFKSSSAIGDCVAAVSDSCKSEATKQQELTANTVCPVGNSHTAAPAAGTARCGVCPVGHGKSKMTSGSNNDQNDGCKQCASISNTATGAVVTCDFIGALEGGSTAGVNVVTAAPAASGDCWNTTDGTIDTGKATKAICEAATARRWASTSGRKCKFGFFYTANVTTGTAANASCAACETGCLVCTSATAGSCSVAKESFWMNNGTPTACTPLNPAAANSCKTSATLKVAVNAFAACPFGNLCTGGPNVSDIDSTCPVPATASAASVGATAPSALAALVAVVLVSLRM